MPVRVHLRIGETSYVHAAMAVMNKRGLERLELESTIAPAAAAARAFACV